MDPVFRVLTRCNRDLDKEIFERFPMPRTNHDSAALTVLGCSAGGLLLQLVILGVEHMETWNVILLIGSLLGVIGSLAFLSGQPDEKERFLQLRETKRRETFGEEDHLKGVLFFEEYYVVHDMLEGKAVRRSYNDVKEIRQSEHYLFLVAANESEPICLEKAGMAEMSVQNAVKWLKLRCRCELVV